LAFTVPIVTINGNVDVSLSIADYNGASSENPSHVYIIVEHAVSNAPPANTAQNPYGVLAPHHLFNQRTTTLY